MTSTANNKTVDHIVVDRHFFGQANNTYIVRNNSRCQIMVFNGLVVDYDVAGAMQFSIFPFNTSFNITSNSSLPNVPRALKFFTTLNTT